MWSAWTFLGSWSPASSDYHGSLGAPAMPSLQCALGPTARQPSSNSSSRSRAYALSRWLQNCLTGGLEELPKDEGLHFAHDVENGVSFSGVVVRPARSPVVLDARNLWRAIDKGLPIMD